MNKSESLINCNSCKIKKVKCSRELPTCKYCCERDIICIYPNKIRRRGVSEVGVTSFITKIKDSSRIKFHILMPMDSKKNETRRSKFILFQPILQPNDFVDEDLQGTVTKIQSNETQFQTHILLKLLTQIVKYDDKLIPQIDFFLSKLKVGVFGGLLKFSIHMSQDWVVELFNPSFEEKCITSYFQNFHPMQTYISKYKFYNNINIICPVLKSVIILAGYSSLSKLSPELLKYLKHLAIVQLKKNMFKIKLSNCQAMFIFSNYLLYQGHGKQSLEYFHQAYLMASALGIHVDMPELNEMDKDERRCIRFTSYYLDAHLCSIIRIQSHYLFLAPSWKYLNPLCQTNPHSKDSKEFLIAECICLSIKCLIMYWAISGNLMNKYSQLTLTDPQAFLIDKNTQVIYIMQTLLNHSLIRTLDLHLSLSRKCKNIKELKIVKKFAKTHVGFYHTLIITVNSQFSPKSSTAELDQSTKKLILSAQALYQNSIGVIPLSIPMLYHNLCSVFLLYIKLILVYKYVPQVKEPLLEKFKQVYRLFISYRSEYSMPVDIFEIIDVIATYYNIKDQ